MRVGINGMGRIGRLALRAAFGAARRPVMDPRRRNRLEVVHVNDAVADAQTIAHLLEFDSVQGRWAAAFGPVLEDRFSVDGQPISVSAHREPAAIPWGELGVDLVLECTGAFRTPGALAGHLASGARRVVVAAPVAPEPGLADMPVLNIVMGVNETGYDPTRHQVVTAASCTTNCLAPVVKVVHEALGIRHGQITTIHDPTNTNRVVDGAHPDLRRARSALLSLAPTTTGSARAIGLIYPELAGRLNGHAVRVPVLNASLTDCVFELEHATTAEIVNDHFRRAADGELAGILGLEDRLLVSADYAGETRSCVVDAASTLVTDGTLLKVYAWYDNEMGYACRMVDVACYLEAMGL